MSEIMVVEDDRTLREIISDVLSYEGYSVRAAANGREALRLVAEVQPDLVLTDLGLPGMSGAELSRQLHALHSGLPVLAISGAELDPSDEQEVQCFLLKPVEVRELLGAVENLLEAVRH